MSALFLALLLAVPASAAVYKWVDDEGVTHYTQQPPPAGEAEVITPGLSSGSEAPPGNRAGGAAGNDAQGDSADDGESSGTQTLADFCRELRDQAQLLASDQEVKLKQDNDTLVTLAGEDRQRRLQQLRNQIEQHCSNN